MDPAGVVASSIRIEGLRNCIEIDESCIKHLSTCEKEVKIGRWRADLKCGDVYVEVEPLERLACGLGQVLLWGSLGVETVLLVFGRGDARELELAARYVPVVYIDAELKYICRYMEGASTCVSFG